MLRGQVQTSRRYCVEKCVSIRRRSFKTLLQNARCVSRLTSGVPGNFVRRGGVQQIQLRTEDRENGDLGAVPPSHGFWGQL